LRCTLVQLQENTQELKLKRREVLRLKGRIYCAGDEERALTADVENTAATDNQAIHSHSHPAAHTLSAAKPSGKPMNTPATLVSPSFSSSSYAAASANKSTTPSTSTAKHSFSYTRRRSTIASPLSKLRHATRRRASSSLGATPSTKSSSSCKTNAKSKSSIDRSTGHRRRQTLAAGEATALTSPLSRSARTSYTHRRH
jgi:hypothetical protein